MSRPPNTEYEKQIYKDYTLRNGRIYRITVRGIQWVVPRGFRRQVVAMAHDALGHFAAKKTLDRLCERIWFPRMRQYVEKYIECCIPCLYAKPLAGRKPGFLYPIEKRPIPFDTIHIDHLGPFEKSGLGNLHILVIIDAFSKYCLLKPVKSTKTRYIVTYLENQFLLFGVPRRIISDRGSAFTSRRFKEFCRKHNIKHIQNAVATPRANGQVERIHQSIIAGLTATQSLQQWDKETPKLQFAMNNTTHRTLNKTPHQVLMGYSPITPAECTLVNEIIDNEVRQDLTTLRREVIQRINKEQERAKRAFDRKRKTAPQYKEGQLVVIQKNPYGEGTSKKLFPKFSGPMVIQRALPHDRYYVEELKGTTRSQKRYQNVIAVDRLKHWVPQGGLSDSTDSGSDGDGVPLPDSD